tara:strand:- start:3702 stop:5087 length:1386 start_codon:yes stop_codon:yes gene_type:complete
MTGSTLGGSAKDWAQLTGSTVDGTNYSAKHWATTADVSTVASGIGNINITAGGITNVNAVGGSIANVNHVAGQISPTNNIASVATFSATLTKTFAVTFTGSVFKLDGVTEPSLSSNSSLYKGYTYIWDFSDSSCSGISSFQIMNTSYHGQGSAIGSSLGLTITGTFGQAGCKATWVVGAGGTGGTIQDINTGRYRINTTDSLGNSISLVDDPYQRLGNYTDEIDTVADNIAKVNTIHTNITHVQNVSAIDSDVTGVNNISAAVTAVNSNSTNINAVNANSTNINTVATNINSVNDFSDKYRISASAPSTSLNEGDLWYDTTNNVLKIYDTSTSGWLAVQQATDYTSITATYTKAQIASTYTGTGLTLDFDTYNNFIITLSSGVNTLANPTTEAGNVGQTGVIIFIQPSSGNAATLSLGTDYETSLGLGLSLSSQYNSRDVVPYVIEATGNILLGSPQRNFE